MIPAYHRIASWGIDRSVLSTYMAKLTEFIPHWLKIQNLCVRLYSSARRLQILWIFTGTMFCGLGTHADPGIGARLHNGRKLHPQEVAILTTNSGVVIECTTS